jgi:hypothetical protein
VRLTNRRPLSVVPDRVDDARRTTTIRRSAAAQEWLVQPGASAAWRTSRVCAPSPPPCAVEARAPRFGSTSRRRARASTATSGATTPAEAQRPPPPPPHRAAAGPYYASTRRPARDATALPRPPRTHTQAVQTKPQAQRMRREIVTTGVATRTTGRRETNRTPTRKLFWFFFFA